MLALQIVSIKDPLTEPRLASLGLQLLSRGQAMGFLPIELSGPATLDLALVAQIGDRLASRGIAQHRALALSSVEEDTAELEEALRTTIAAIDASPQPEGEWGPARELLGDELLARLVGISPASLRRYATGARRTPDDTAWRLHVVARILGALLGSYNAYGIRRWFERSRTALEGRTPADVIEQAESEDDEALLAVLRLADSLAGGAAAA